MEEIKQGYKQTDIGVIPEDWDVRPLGDVISKTQLGGNYPNNDKMNCNPLIKMGNLNRGYINLEKLQYIKSPTKPISQDKLHFGDLLFNTRNTLELVGKVAIWRDELKEAYFNSNIMRIKFHEKFISSNFFMNLTLNTRLSIEQLKGIAIGTTSVSAIYNRDLFTIPIILPTLREQTAIATALSDTDALIAALDKKIAKKQQIKQGAMQQLLTGKKRLPGFSGEWVEKKLGEVFFVRSGYGFPISYQGNKNGIIPFYKVSDMNNVGNEVFLSNSNNYISEENISKLNIRLFRKGSILFAKIGAAIFLERKRIASYYCSIDNNMMGLEKKEDSTEETYFYHLLNTIKLSDLSSSSALPSLSSNTIENIIILIPKTKSEQTAVAQLLTDMDHEIAQLQKERDKYKELKAGMMQVLLTGKVRLV